MAVAYVQGTVSDGSSTLINPSTATFSGAQASGDYNLVCVGNYSGTVSTTVVSITDTSKNTYTQIGGPLIVSTTGPVYLFLAGPIFPAGAGANTVTVTWSTTCAFTEVVIAEYSGVAPYFGLDTPAVSTSGSGVTSITVGPYGTTFPGDALISYNRTSGGTITVPGGFTLRSSTTTLTYGQLADNVPVATGYYNVTWSTGTTNVMAAFLLALRPGPNLVFSDGISVKRVS